MSININFQHFKTEKKNLKIFQKTFKPLSQLNKEQLMKIMTSSQKNKDLVKLWSKTWNSSSKNSNNASMTSMEYFSLTSQSSIKMNLQLLKSKNKSLKVIQNNFKAFNKTWWEISIIQFKKQRKKNTEKSYCFSNKKCLLFKNKVLNCTQETFFFGMMKKVRKF